MTAQYLICHINSYIKVKPEFSCHFVEKQKAKLCTSQLSELFHRRQRGSKTLMLANVPCNCLSSWCVIHIYILLANTTWCTKQQINNQQQQKQPENKKFSLGGGPRGCPVRSTISLIVLSINLVRLVWQLSDNCSLNIQGGLSHYQMREDDL